MPQRHAIELFVLLSCKSLDEYFPITFNHLLVFLCSFLMLCKRNIFISGIVAHAHHHFALTCCILLYSLADCQRKRCFLSQALLLLCSLSRIIIVSPPSTPSRHASKICFHSFRPMIVHGHLEKSLAIPRCRGLSTALHSFIGQGALLRLIAS